MDFDLQEIEELSGAKARVYSVVLEGEGIWADGVVALNHTGCLRLYGIYFNDTVILFGSGGYKPPHVRAYQDYSPLNAKAEQMKEIAQTIMKRIRSGELRIEEDGTLTMD